MMKAYPKYKDSGVPWLEHVPEHWETIKTKHLFSERIQKGYPNEPLLAATQTKGVVPKSMYENKTVEALKDLHLLKLVKPGDFVISLRSFQGGIEYAYYRGIISPAYTVMTPNQRIIPEYYKYLAKSKDFISLLQTCVTGIREGQNINYDVLRKTPMPIPAQDEQKQISRYLDWQTSKINKFIKAKKRLIALLKEQKQNVINQAVTRGLDPKVNFKPSGVEWIGDIPEHWEARKLKFASKMIAGGATPASGQSELWDGDVVWVTPQDVSKNERLSSSARKLTSAGFASCSTVMVPPGSVVVTSRAPVGNVSFAEVELCTNQGCKAVVPDQRYLLNEYCFVLLKVMQPVFQRAANGTTFFEISTWAFENIKAPLPPTSEQEAILAQIKEATSKIDQAIIRAQREIELMREYRTRLISDVVTGQVDVRNMKCEGGSLNEDEFEDIEEVEEEIELPEGGEDDE